MPGFNLHAVVWKAIGVGLAIVALVCASQPEQAGAQSAPVFQGTWEGTFTQVRVPGLREKMYPPQVWRMIVQGSTVRMFIRADDGRLSEIKPGVFKIAQHMTNALVYSVDSARDGSWIETESWLLMQKTPDMLTVLFAGAVKNPRTSDPEILNFFTVRTGDFRRVQ